MKKIKIALTVFSLLLFVAAVAVVVFLKSFDVNEYKPVIENAVSETLGREFKIGSDIELALALKPTVVMQDIALRNPDWASSKNMVEIKKAFVSFSLVDLFFGKVNVQKIEINEPKIFLEVSKQGLQNWDFSGESSGNKNAKAVDEKVKKSRVDGGFSPSYEFDDIIIVGAEVSFRNFQTGLKKKIELKQITLNQAGDLNVDAVFDGKSLVLKGSLPNVSGLVNKEKKFPLSLTLNAGKNVIKVDGKIGNIFELSDLDIRVKAEGKDVDVIDVYSLQAKLLGSANALQIADINAKAGDAKKILAAVSGKIKNVNAMSGVNLDMKIDAVNPSDLGLKPFELTLKIDEVKGTNSASGEINFRAGKTDITGDVGIDASGKIPYVSANLKSSYYAGEDVFDSSEQKSLFAGNKKAQKEDGAEEIFVFSDEPIPFAKLSDFNADIKADFANIVIYGEDAARLNFNAKLKDAVLDASAKITSGEKSKIVLDSRIDAREKTLAKININAVGEDIILSDWAHRFFKDEIKGGVLNISLKANSYGDSLHILMTHFTGNLTVLVENMKAGIGLKKVLGSNFFDSLSDVFAGVINKGGKRDDGVDLQCLAANLDFVNGKSGFDKKIALESQKAFITASGDLNVGEEKMDLSFVVSSGKGVSTGISDMISSMVKVKGTFMEPTVSVNAEGVIGTAATIGAAVVTGGISYLGQKLIGGMSSTSSPCAEALGRPVKSSRFYKEETKKTKAKQAPVSEKTSSKKSVQKLLNDKKKVIKID